MGAFGNLSAVTGERLEYWLPGSVMDSLGYKGAMAVCLPNTESALGNMKLGLHKQARRAERAAKSVAYAGEYMTEKAAKSYNRRANIAKNKALSLVDTVKLLEAEVEKLRARGVAGPIPVCLYRESGKKAGTTRWERRSVANHERFHAALRRLEAKHNIGRYGLWRVMGEVLDELPGAWEARAWASIEGWSKTHESLVEEILARTEEIRKACVRSQADCQDITDNFHLREQRISGQYLKADAQGIRRPVIFNRSMQTLSEAITKKYGGALALAGEALRRRQKAEADWEAEKLRQGMGGLRRRR